MAPTKRSASDASGTSKAKFRDTNEPAPKRVRKSDSSTEQTRDGQTTTNEFSKNKPLGAKSVLKSESKSFPRGGGSVLTPLEHKQIQNEAAKDVLFEQSVNKKGREDHSHGEEAVKFAAETTGKGPRRHKSIRNGEGPDIAATAEKAMRTDSLSYKNLAPGTLVLGQVAKITSRDVVVKLPNNLSGFVQLSGVSEQLNSKIANLFEKAEGEEREKQEFQIEEDEDNGVDDNIELSSFFYVGQYLRVCVTSKDASESSNNIAKKRIELSVDPRETNRGLGKSGLVVNGMVQASVLSNEDHGLVMDLGLGDAKVRGFMSSKELPSNLKHEEVLEGTVLLCLITGLSSDGRIVKLSADHSKVGNVKKTHFLVDAPTVDTFLPGTAVELLLTDISAFGVNGKIMGMLDASVDIIHSGAANSHKDLENRYKIGNKVKGRITATFPDADVRRVAVSFLHHVTNLTTPRDKNDRPSAETPQPLDVSSFVEAAKVTKVHPNLGLFFDIGVPAMPGFAHISRISDRRIDNISGASGPYAVGTSHRARVLGFNPMDGLHILSLEQRVLEQPFLQLEDVRIGQVVHGTVKKLFINETGTPNLTVQIAEGIVGLVAESHFADAHLEHPEKKFREGVKVIARILSINLTNRRFRMTLKKSLVNSDADTWSTYDNISVGDQSPGTVLKLLPTGAVVEFYNRVTAFLPKSEMSEAYIDNPSRHFRIGQVVNVRVLSVDPRESRMIVSCRDPSAIDTAQRDAFKALKVGNLVTATVLEKSDDSIAVEVAGDVKGIIRMGHLTDGTEKKERSAFKRIRVGQKLDGLLILKKIDKRSQIDLTNKPSLVEAAKNGTLITKFEDLSEGQVVDGFVRNFDTAKIFVEFGGEVVGALFKSQLNEDVLSLPNYGLRVGLSLAARISHIDFGNKRFLLSMKPSKSTKDTTEMLVALEAGTKTKATITQVMSTQILVKTENETPGRIDVSEVYDDWDSISNKKQPLRDFEIGQKLDVTVIGSYNVRGYRFLPLSHRKSGNSILELTARRNYNHGSEDSILTMDKVKVDDTYTGFVNKVADGFAWLNLSPSVRGRMDIVEALNTGSSMNGSEESFPIGSAVRIKVRNVDVAKGQLDLASVAVKEPLSWDALSDGLILLGRVRRSFERYVLIQLSDSINGIIPRTELADNYDEASPTNLDAKSTVRVKVVHLDKPNKHITLSVRPSNVLDSGIKPTDRQILRKTDLKANDVVRGFIKNVAANGIFINLGPNVDGFVKVSDLSDSYIKDWKGGYQVDQLVRAKVLDANSENAVPLSLKASVLDEHYVPPARFEDFEQGQIVTGTIRVIFQYGVIILVDNSLNVSGLCHRSQIADERIDNLEALYEKGDKVKAIILKLDPEQRKISFGMKASYFERHGDAEDIDSDIDEGNIDLDEVEDNGSITDADAQEVTNDVETNSGGCFEIMDVDAGSGDEADGLATSGFDWTGVNMDIDDAEQSVDEEVDASQIKKRRKRRAEIVEDRTDALDKYGPQSVADFERLLLGSPNDSYLWIQYMAFQAALNEIDKCRDIARRALDTINMKDQEAKMEVRTALLNLEIRFGSDETVEEVFKAACQVHGPYEMHNRLVDIYIKEKKLEKADMLYQSMQKIKEITVHVVYWVSYANFLLTSLNAPARKQALLARAVQSVPASQHRDLTAKFASLEFKSPNGNAELGRTIFEDLLNIYPKKWDLWDSFVQLEKAHGEEANVRTLYERMGKSRMKSRRGQLVFNSWKKWEASIGNKKGEDRVRALEEQWEKRKKAADIEDE
ncbi:ribosomal RNA processing protein RRP5 [Pseudovirgaria hyperparasitica]|uniref:rRNA biogenesis protein RRP5 n=1 Tax=Pseudovirgaria hyperparasitica TaxID=470096 RepID=A0A6A6WK71_9PEZI|nr:ribosomal RNA processing protein RRP5 [Pseudovirgaria hyperparasitica]KAF2762569.1 ribosomal RNA processing protein RRP5 [Pseudovirgaria hyperparasitica]